MDNLPDFAAIVAARARIAAYVRRTPVVRSDALDARAGAAVHFKCENRQRGGAFKYRGALNAVWSLSDAEAARGVVTHSSGNHGAALALAARSRGIAAHVVVPDGAVAEKVRNIEAAGGIVHRCAPTLAAREAGAAALVAELGATLVHPFADPRVIAGQGTAALELLDQAGPLDLILTPIGGGGLASGSAIAAHGVDPAINVVAAEPEGAADAIASLAAGRCVTDIQPDTICDGLRAAIGAIDLDCLRAHRVAVLPVSDEETIAAMRLLHETLGEIVEPSSATVLAAVLRHPAVFAGKRIGAILTGGNVERERWPWLAGAA